MSLHCTWAVLVARALRASGHPHQAVPDGTVVVAVERRTRRVVLLMPRTAFVHEHVIRGAPGVVGEPRYGAVRQTLFLAIAAVEMKGSALRDGAQVVEVARDHRRIHLLH